MGGMKIMGYKIPDSTDHILVDWNTLTIARRTEDCIVIWEETYVVREWLENWLEEHMKEGLICA